MRHCCLLLALVLAGSCGAGSGDAKPAATPECCPLARLCESCGCSDEIQAVVDNDDPQDCTRELGAAAGLACEHEVLGSAERSCRAHGADLVDVEETIVGDWFRCADDACGRLTDKGVRYASNGRYSDLYFPVADRASAGRSRDGDPYCVSAERGSYTYDYPSASLTLISDGVNAAPAIVKMFINGDYASGHMLRVRENASGTPTSAGCDTSATGPLD